MYLVKATSVLISLILLDFSDNNCTGLHSTSEDITFAKETSHLTPKPGAEKSVVNHNYNFILDRHKHDSQSANKRYILSPGGTEDNFFSDRYNSLTKQIPPIITNLREPVDSHLSRFKTIRDNSVKVTENVNKSTTKKVYERSPIDVTKNPIAGREKTERISTIEKKSTGKMTTSYSVDYLLNDLDTVNFLYKEHEENKRRTLEDYERSPIAVPKSPIQREEETKENSAIGKKSKEKVITFYSVGHLLNDLNTIDFLYKKHEQSKRRTLDEEQSKEHLFHKQIHSDQTNDSGQKVRLMKFKRNLKECIKDHDCLKRMYWRTWLVFANCHPDSNFFEGIHAEKTKRRKRDIDDQEDARDNLEISPKKTMKMLTIAIFKPKIDLYRMKFFVKKVAEFIPTAFLDMRPYNAKKWQDA